jgi:quercetin dioxygenase-like cupin family protein
MTIPPHTHDGSSEYLYLLEGSGVMTIGADRREVAAGDAIQIPPGTLHGMVVAAGGPIKAIQLYTPAGPEQRFRKAPAP